MTKSIVRVLASGAAVLAGEHRAPRSATAKAVNYTPEQETAILEMASAQADGKIDSVLAGQLAEKFGKTVKSLTAKASRMGLYRKAEYHNKAGEKPVRKDAHAEAIGAVLGMSEGDVDSLCKANKRALAMIFEALANSKPIEC